TPIGINVRLTVSVSPTASETGLPAGVKYVHHSLEVERLVTLSALTTARMLAALVVYHAESVGRFWLFRVPSAQVSSSSTSACAGRIARPRTKRSRKKYLRRGDELHKAESRAG